MGDCLLSSVPDSSPPVALTQLVRRTTKICLSVANDMGGGEKVVQGSSLLVSTIVRPGAVRRQAERKGRTVLSKILGFLDGILGVYYLNNASMRIHRIYFLILGLALVASGLSIKPAVVRAYHNKGQFPYNGLLYMSNRENYWGLLYMSSTNCNSSETGAYSRVQSSTANTWEMARWGNRGIQMIQYACDGRFDPYIDILIQYTSGHPSGAWGESHSTLESSAYCQWQWTSYPCGTRAIVHINRETWNSISDLNRQRLIMHETGHSNGLSHHCDSDSIMNDGTSACRGWRWLSVMSYQSTDRSGISGIYP